MKNKKILLVEDEVIIAMKEKEELTSLGYNVIHETTGEKAVEIALDNSEQINLILMDIDLGKGIDGTDAAEKILQKVDLPIVFLSSHCEPEIVAKTEKITSYGYVDKQSGITILDASIKMALKLFDANKKILDENANFIDKIFNSSAFSLWISDEHGTAIRANPACLKFFGATEDEVIGKYNLFKDIVLEQQGVMSNIKKVFKEGVTESIIIDYDFAAVDHVHVKNATHKIMNSIFTPIIDKNGKVINVIVEAIDLTEIKKAEQALKDSENLHKEAQRVAHIGHWELDPEVGTPVWSDETFRIFGLDPEQREPSFVELEKLIHPEDWPKLNEDVTRALEKGIPYDNHFRILLPNNKITWMHSLGKVIKNEKGKVIKIFGTAQDVTDLKKAEINFIDAYKEKEALLSELQHRVKNSFTTIISFMSMKSMLSKSDDVKAAVEDLKTRTVALSDLYNILYETGKVNEINLEKYINRVIYSLSGTILDIDFSTDIDNIQTSAKTASTIGMILTELITNTSKYASVKHKKIQMDISLKNTPEGHQLNVSDNGIGLPEDFELNKGNSMGLKLIHEMMKQLGGELSFKNSNGAHFSSLLTEL